MTQTEALRLALEALEYASTGNRRPEIIGPAMTAIKAALEAKDEPDWKDMYEKEKRHSEMWVAKYEKDIGPLEKAVPHQKAKDEPVAWMFEFPDKRVKPKFDSAPHGGNWQPLYTNPQPDAYGYAKRLAEAIWKKHYQFTAPQWEPFNHLIGVLTQIDNMTSGLTTPPAAQPASVQEREFVGLTDKELEELSDAELGTYDLCLEVEAKLRSKNI